MLYAQPIVDADWPIPFPVSMRLSLALLLVLTAHCALAAESASPGSVELTAALSKRIMMAPVEARPFSEMARLPGRVALDEHRVARIGPSISGRVVEIRAYTGRNVRKGDILAVLNSTELSNAQASYLKARTQMGLQRLAVERARRLYREGIISEATLKEREGGLAEAEVEIRAVADQLGIMGMSDAAIDKLSQTGQINSITPVTATLSGTVIERHISVGTIAEISDELFTVADLSTVWVEAEAPEQDAHAVQMNDRVEVHIPALPQQHFSGKIVFVADTVHPETRTVTLRMQVDNPQRSLKPGMLADMLIKRSTAAALAIPAQAVLREAGKDHVFVETARNRLELRQVILDEDRDGQRRVLSGLTPGERIVVEGAFHLNNARNLKELE